VNTYDRGVTRARIGSQSEHKLRRAQLGQVGAEDHDVGHVHQGFAHGGHAIGRLADAESAAIQGVGQISACPLVVVHDQNVEVAEAIHLRS
jgi:hypothetical protein